MIVSSAECSELFGIGPLRLRVRIEIERRILVLPGPGLFDQAAVAPHDSDQVDSDSEFVTPHSGTGVIIQLRAVADSLLIAALCRARVQWTR